jgi:DNA-binding MarR family transcriptional regulator
VLNDATHQRLLPALERIVVASVAATARALAETAPELTFLQWRVLVLVDQADGIPVGAIATALNAKIAAVSRLIGRMKSRGLVETHRGEQDARVVLVTLTNAGASLKALVVERRRIELETALVNAPLGPDAMAIIQTLADAMERGG